MNNDETDFTTLSNRDINILVAHELGFVFDPMFSFKWATDAIYCGNVTDSDNRRNFQYRNFCKNHSRQEMIDYLNARKG